MMAKILINSFPYLESLEMYKSCRSNVFQSWPVRYWSQVTGLNWSTMAFLQKQFVILLLVLAVSSSLHALVAGGNEIGVNYGTVGNNLPSPADVVAMYRQYNIRFMRIFSPDPAILQALEDTQRGQLCLYVIVGTTNEDIPVLASSLDAAKQWVNTHVQPFPHVCWDYITVGNEAIPGPYAAQIAPAMKNLRLALLSFGHVGILVSTVVPSSALGVSYPPSQGLFSAETIDNMRAILNEMYTYYNATTLMINVYPYFAYASDPINIPLAYAHFTATAPVVHDGPFEYWNLFDAMVDAFYSAMEKAGYPTTEVKVTETGWPSDGNGQMTTPELAKTYNTNLRTRIDSGTGTPKRPNNGLHAYIFAMFNENKKPAGVEQYWGLFNPDKTLVYPFF